MTFAPAIATSRGDRRALVEIADVGGNQMSTVESDIGQLEKAVNTLVRRPQLIRQEYWASEIEHVLERPGITARDRQRLVTLVGLLATVMSSRPAQATDVSSGPGNVHCLPLAPSTSHEDVPS
jgi:hypothetical protein